MAPQSDSTPLVVIVGETASGKSALAMEMARRFNGEIIAADSRTVYRGMDIATAKPTKADQTAIAHHLLDVTTPDKPLTVADFKRLALTAISDIGSRGRLPLLVGGSGLYIDAVLYDFGFRGKANLALRKQLQGLSGHELQAYAIAHTIPLPSDDINPRHLMRAIETAGQPHNRKDLRPNTLVIGVEIERAALRQAVTARIETMVHQGLVAEAEHLGAQYGWTLQALQTPGYKALHDYLAGICTLDEAKAQFVRSDMLLAKRQRTWFGRNKSIHWIRKQEQAVDLITAFLHK